MSANTRIGFVVDCAVTKSESSSPSKIMFCLCIVIEDQATPIRALIGFFSALSYILPV